MTVSQDRITESFEIMGAARRSRWLVTCDHASNHVPDWVAGGNLGLPAADMTRHIAYDPGAAGVSRALSDLLECPAVLSRFSRLVMDPNRGEDDPTLLMRLYDGSVIPANRNADSAAREERLQRLYRPYHAAIESLAARQDDTVIVAVHSFTPQLRGRQPRPWHIGILFDPADPDYSQALIDLLRAEGDLSVGANQPYSGHLPGDSIDRHALRYHRLNTLIEIRNDLITTPAQQAGWAARLAPLLQRALTLI